jgi:hypothetical protein
MVLNRLESLVNCLPRRAVLLALCGVALRGRAEDGGVESPLTGTWKLDEQASSDLVPVLEHFRAGLLVRKFATGVSPTNVIAVSRDRLDIEVKALGVTRKNTLLFDGKTPTEDELFGNPYQYTSRFEAGAVVSKGKVKHGDGEEDELSMRRFIAPDGKMVLQMTIVPPSAKPLEVRRVFNRVAR